MSAPDAEGRFEDGEHRLDVRVYYEDTDATGIVYHANFLRFFERGRTDFVRMAGVSHTALRARPDPLVFAVRDITIEFLKPARVDDRLTVRTRNLGLKGPRMRLAQSVERDGEVLARGEVQVVFIRPGGGAVRPPADVVDVFGAYFSGVPS